MNSLCPTVECKEDHRSYIRNLFNYQFCTFHFDRVKTSLVSRRSLLTRCPREVWERVGEYLSVTSQLTVVSRINRAENSLSRRRF